MEVKLKHITPNAEAEIVEIARVSSKRKDKSERPEGLINYLIKHKHWSPFEMANVCFEIETSKAIGIQLIRHRSFSFQEMSLRYQIPENVYEGSIFEDVKLRKQSDNNRQSSTESFNPDILIQHDDNNSEIKASKLITNHFNDTEKLYNLLIENGVARECARFVLPLALKTKIFMSGSIRSWLHFLEIRDDEHAQLEIQLIAKEIKTQLKEHLPIIASARNW